jgi:hypothetical protein
MLNILLTKLKMKWWEMVVGIRSGQIKVVDFSRLMSRISNEQFPFNIRNQATFIPGAFISIFDYVTSG